MRHFYKSVYVITDRYCGSLQLRFLNLLNYDVKKGFAVLKDNRIVFCFPYAAIFANISMR